MSEAHITIKRLETRLWHCKVTTNGTAQNLTGCTISFTVKKYVTDADENALFQLGIGSGITLTDTTGGLYDLGIASTLTSGVTVSSKNEAFHFDHRIEIPGSTGIKVLESGPFIVEPGITQTMV